MNTRKFCRICLSAVFAVSSNMRASGDQVEKLLLNVFPEMNIVLTDDLRLCEECFNDVNFITGMRKSITQKGKDFLRMQSSSCTKVYCGVCFRFKTVDMIVFCMEQFPREPLKKFLESTFIEFEKIGVPMNICGICWSWIKKIHSFKKQFLDLETSLNHFCLKRNLTLLSDEDLEAFLFEQYCERTGKEVSPAVKTPYQIFHKEYCLITGQIFPNFKAERSMELERDTNLVYSQDEYSKDGEEKYIHIKDEGILQEYGNITVSEIEPNTKIYTNSTDEGTVDSNTDDEFDEAVERKTQNIDDFVIISDDDEDNGCTPPIDVLRNICHKDSSDLHKDCNITNNVEENLRAYVIFKQTKNDSEISLRKFASCNDNNNFKKSIDNIPTLVDEESIKNTQNHQRSSHTSTFDDGNGLNNYPESNSAGTFGNSPLDLTTRNIILEDTGNFTSINLNVLPSEKGNAEAENYEEILNSPLDFSQDNSIDLSNITMPCLADAGSNEHDNNNIGQGSDLSNDVIILDQDCFEVVPDHDNTVIDMSNIQVDYYLEDYEAIRNQTSDMRMRNSWGCYICAAMYYQKYQMREHMLSHERPLNKYGGFQCKKCPYRSCWKGSITRHQIFHSKGYVNKFFGHGVLYFCPYCSNIYDTRGDIQSHINEHVISWKSFFCCDCMYTTDKSDTLRQHYWKIHEKGRDPSFSATH